MKTKQLLEALGQLDEQYILEAVSETQRTKERLDSVGGGCGNCYLDSCRRHRNGNGCQRTIPSDGIILFSYRADRIRARTQQ